MPATSNITAPTQFVETKLEKYAYRRFGNRSGLPLLCLQHFTGTLDNWDPAVTDPLALGREVILFESAGLGRSTGEVPASVSGMAAHALAFADALGLTRVDILGFSLGGMVAQEIALERPSLVRKMLLVATAPERGEDIMHMEKPELRKVTEDPNLPGLQRLVKLFFAPSVSSQAAGEAFIARLAQRKQDREPLSSPNVAKAQIAAFRAWEAFTGERFTKLRKINQPCLVVNGVFDNMIPVRNSYMLSEHLPNAMLLTYPTLVMGRYSSFMTRSSDKLRCFWILRNYGRNEQRIPYSSGGTLRDLVNSERTIKVDHVTIRSNKPFATVKANLERLVPKLDEEISELAAAGEVARLKEKLEQGPELAVFLFRDHGVLLKIIGRSSKAVQYEIGNPLTASKMTRLR